MNGGGLQKPRQNSTGPPQANRRSAAPTMNVASADARQTDLGNKRAKGIDGEGEPRFQCSFLFVAERSTTERLGRSPGSEVQSVLYGCFTFPGRWPSGRSKRRPHSQWRDRAGFAPDFPVMPLVGTQGEV